MAVFQELIKRLRENEVEYFVIGGVAAALHGSPVATYDLDICAPMSEENLTRILRVIRDVHPRHRMRPDKLPVTDDVSHLRGVKNLYLDTDLGTIDIMNEVPGVGLYAQVVSRTDGFIIAGVECRVLNLDTLILSKALAGRDKDIYGVRHLKAIQEAQQKQPTLFDAPKPPAD
jgi:hypothetical protein